jgi:hypothetical protein
MPLIRYYLSASPGDPSPVTDQLLSIEADSVADAALKLHRANQLPVNARSLWIHVLVWADSAGRNRGFESIQLSKLLAE